VLQCVAVCCSALSGDAFSEASRPFRKSVAVCCDLLQCVAVRCSVAVNCVAVCCSGDAISLENLLKQGDEIQKHTELQCVAVWQLSRCCCNVVASFWQCDVAV